MFLTVLALLAVPSRSGASFALPHPERECASVRATYGEHGTTQYILLSEIRTEGVGCTEARGIAADYGTRSHHTYRRHGQLLVANTYPGAVGSFGCLSDRLGSDVRSVKCREGHRALVFAWYDSSPYH